MKVGEYVRTEDGYIGKITDLDKDKWCQFDNDIYESFGERFNLCYLDNLLIHISSPNIIDLIKVGDYVTYEKNNMYWNIPTRVTGIFDELTLTIVKMVGDEYLKDINITSIVTKEQFESMEYKIKE